MSLENEVYERKLLSTYHPNKYVLRSSFESKTLLSKSLKNYNIFLIIFENSVENSCINQSLYKHFCYSQNKSEYLDNSTFANKLLYNSGKYSTNFHFKYEK